ncbi:hypothetical protein [Sphingobium sp.]|uniref:hypothetical protein n=1 Tax=Sphingobium sp. TaxID=1912891 RepID=UPI0028BDBD02|nr:hypothetical protein [Sphingobium sp.]
MSTEDRLDSVLGTYQKSFVGKVYGEENDDHDLLMDAFGISPALKRENRQYWGRELGFCWQLLIIQACVERDDYKSAFKVGSGEPCDLIVGKYAIDTKYRIGSGDAGTLKKFKSYGPLLREHGYEPVLLILREDNLPAAIQACKMGTWAVFTGKDSFKFISDISGFDMEGYLTSRASKFQVER